MTVKRGRKDKRARIDQLLSMAWNTNSTARALAIANQILEIDPDCIEAILLKADNITDNSQRIDLLLKVLSIFENLDKENALSDFDERELFFLVVNQRLAYTFFIVGDHEKALSFCETAIKFAEEHEELDENEENNSDIKTLYYRILIERKEWRKILSETMRDDEHNLAWGYARLVAAWMTAPDKARKVCANMFWDVLMMAPDVPFYMLGYFEEPDDKAEPEVHDEFGFALMYYDVLSVSDEFFNWFSRGVILFGLLSGRFDEKESDYMIDVLDSLGGYEEYQRMSEILVETEDSVVIETLAANKCLMD